MVDEHQGGSDRQEHRGIDFLHLRGMVLHDSLRRHVEDDSVKRVGACDRKKNWLVNS